MASRVCFRMNKQIIQKKKAVLKLTAWKQANKRNRLRNDNPLVINGSTTKLYFSIHVSNISVFIFFVSAHNMSVRTDIQLKLS